MARAPRGSCKRLPLLSRETIPQQLVAAKHCLFLQRRTVSMQTQPSKSSRQKGLTSSQAKLAVYGDRMCSLPFPTMPACATYRCPLVCVNDERRQKHRHTTMLCSCTSPHGWALCSCNVHAQENTIPLRRRPCGLREGLERTRRYSGCPSSASLLTRCADDMH